MWGGVVVVVVVVLEEDVGRPVAGAGGLAC